MEIESEESHIHSEEESIDMEPLNLKTNKKLVLTHQAESDAFSIANRRVKTTELNRIVDPHNKAQKSYLTLKTKQVGNFQHFLTKNKHREERKEVFDVLRELAQSKNHVLSGRVSDKLQHSKMILRVVAKEDSTLVMIEDETGKEKMMIRSGTVWVGMIALMEVSWSDNCYKLDVVYDLGSRLDTAKTTINEANFAYRMLFVKGALMRNESKDNIGLKVIMDELMCLKDKERVKVNCVVIMGPLLSSKNKILTGFLENTYEEEAIEQIKLIKDEIHKKYDQIDLVFMPSTDDLTTLYPIPQPKFSYSQDFLQKNIHFTTNPGLIQLTGGRQKITIDLINIDVLNYIDENRAGRASIEVMQENLETYFKQPFYLTNTMQEPFDETNLPSLYNSGQFGNIVVTSSRKSPPFAREVKGRVFINIGSLGIDQQHLSQKHYMTLVSMYDGSGPLGGRTKVEVISM